MRKERSGRNGRIKNEGRRVEGWIGKLTCRRLEDD